MNFQVMENKGYKVIEYVRLDFDQSESRISQTWPNWNGLSVRYRSWFFKMGEENVLCDFSIVGTNRPQSVKNLVSRKTNLIYNSIDYF